MKLSDLVDAAGGPNAFAAILATAVLGALAMTLLSLAITVRSTNG